MIQMRKIIIARFESKILSVTPADWLLVIIYFRFNL